MMRPLIIAVPVVVVLAGAAAAGWHVLRPHDPLAEARFYMSNGDARAAELVLRTAVQADPSRAEAHFRLALVQLRLGDPVAAERELHNAADHGWDEAAIRPVLAQAVAAQHRDEEVLRTFRPDGLAPDRAATVLIARAQAQVDLHRPDDAAASAEEAMRLAPASSEAKLAAARLALARGDRAAAVTLVDAALAVDPHALEALLLKGRIQAESSDLQGALATYTAAVDLVNAQANNGVAGAVLVPRLARAGILAMLGRDAEEQADLDVILKAQPKQPAANFLRARLQIKASDWKGADASLLTIAPLLSKFPNGDLLQAIVKGNLNQPEQAIEAAQRQLVHTPDNLPAAKLLARLEFAQKRPDLAAKALAAVPGALDTEGLEMLSEAYSAGGEPANAVQAMRQASQSQPGDTRVLARLAALELRQGDAGQAVDALQHMLDVDEAAAHTAADAAPGQTVVASLEPTPTAAPKPEPGQPGAPSQAQIAETLVVAALRAGEIDRAVAALGRLDTAKVAPAEAAMLSGTVKMAQADFAGARTQFETAHRLDPKRIDAAVQLARTMALLGDPSGAEALLKQTLAADPGNVAVLLGLISLPLATGQTEQALAQAEAAHAAAPDSLPITGELANLYFATNQPQKALDLANAAGGPGKDAAEKALRPVRIRAEIALGNRAAAVALMRPMLAEAPDNVPLRRQIADLLANDKDYDGARAVLRDGLARHPGEPNLVAGLVAVAGAEGGPAAAVARAGELARDPAFPGAVTLKGDVLMAQGHYAEAQAAFEAQLAALPKDDPHAYLLQIGDAQAIAATGKPDDAAAMLRTLIATHPDDGATLVLSSLDVAARRLPQARAELETVLAHAPNNIAALNNLAWVRQQQGDLPAARTLAERAHLLAPAPQTADTLGWIVLAQGDVSDALTLLRSAALGRQNDPAIAYHYAAALARDGQKEAAVTKLKAVLGDTVRFDEKPQAAKLLADLQS